MSNEIKEVAFSDLDFFFKVHPVTKDVPILRNVAAIKRSIRNLVLTNGYEKFYKPKLYAGVLESLFENFDPILVTTLQNKIRQVLQFEPRAVVNDVLISNHEELDRNGINITINFTPVNRIRRESVDVFLERVR